MDVLEPAQNRILKMCELRDNYDCGRGNTNQTVSYYLKRTFQGGMKGIIKPTRKAPRADSHHRHTKSVNKNLVLCDMSFVMILTYSLYFMFLMLILIGPVKISPYNIYCIFYVSQYAIR